MKAIAIQLDPAAVVLGADVSVQVTRDGSPLPGATVVLVHRPDLPGERQEAVGVTDSLGRVRWTPDSPGVATLETDGASLRVAIPYGVPPADSAVVLALLVVAACVAIVAGAVASRRYLPGSPR